MEWNVLTGIYSTFSIGLGWRSYREEFASSEGADSFLYEYHPGSGSKL